MGDTLENEFIQLMNVDAPDAKAKCDTITVSARNAILLMAVLGGIGTLLSLLLGVSISKMISWPVQKFTMFAKMMAVGDLDLGKYVDERYKRVFLRKDEIGGLRERVQRGGAQHNRADKRDPGDRDWRPDDGGDDPV